MIDLDSPPESPADDGEKIEKMMTMTVAAAKGIVPLGQVMLPLAQIANGELAPLEARQLAMTFTRILQGERDPVTLVEALTPEFAEVIWETLAQIEAPLPEVDEAERQPLTFEALIEKVAEACTGKVILWQRLWDFTEELAADTRLTPAMRSMGAVLHKILAGERQSYLLDELADEHRWAVAQLLSWLNEQAATPEMGDNEA